MSSPFYSVLDRAQAWESLGIRPPGERGWTATATAAFQERPNQNPRFPSVSQYALRFEVPRYQPAPEIQQLPYERECSESQQYRELTPPSSPSVFHHRHQGSQGQKQVHDQQQARFNQPSMSRASQSHHRPPSNIRLSTPKTPTAIHDFRNDISKLAQTIQSLITQLSTRDEELKSLSARFDEVMQNAVENWEERDGYRREVEGLMGLLEVERGNRMLLNGKIEEARRRERELVQREMEMLEGLRRGRRGSSASAGKMSGGYWWKKRGRGRVRWHLERILEER